MPVTLQEENAQLWQQNQELKTMVDKLKEELQAERQNSKIWKACFESRDAEANVIEKDYIKMCRAGIAS